jgi:protein pelota
MAGIHELMKAGLGAEVVQESRAAQETKMVETVLERIAKDELVAYGPVEVDRAVAMGAVDTLVVLDSELRKGRAERWMADVERARGNVMVVSERFEAGKKLEALGGAAALLRYRLPQG